MPGSRSSNTPAGRPADMAKWARCRACCAITPAARCRTIYPTSTCFVDGRLDLGGPHLQPRTGPFRQGLHDRGREGLARRRRQLAAKSSRTTGMSASACAGIRSHFYVRT
jgi:hypothetical protein